MTMTNVNQNLSVQTLVNKIYIIRDQKVMLDSDLADIYGIETKYLNRAVKRNERRFPELFMFQLTDKEFQNLRFQIGTSSEKNLQGSQNVASSWGGRRTNPYVFTEHGAIMLASVLKTETAVKASIRIIEAFVEMRKFIKTNAQLFARMDTLELKMLQTQEKVDIVYQALEPDVIKPRQGIFYDGQVFDAYNFVSDLIRSAKTSLVLIDNYIDDTVLTLFTKCKRGVKLSIFTKEISKSLKLDVKKHNTQYPPIEIKELKIVHDRFLIIDHKELYHFGASLKDLGKKCFAFSKMEYGVIDMLEKLNIGGEKDE